MKKTSKRIFSKGQAAIEYLLLLTICALIAFFVFRSFFDEESGRARQATNAYFTEVQNHLMGEPPDFDTGDAPIDD
ncbi:MAG: hypothetical protein P9M07_07915 [Candidatus Aceula meridiana]|nr:hypothetical protein [Candidatus Aceula meridiana]